MSGKVRYNLLSEQERKKYLGDFYSMVSILKTRDEVKNFFKDLLTLSEIVMISRRIQIARLLLDGQTYETIKKKLKVGTATICQVEKWLNNGFGGYRKTIADYKKKYPAKSDFEKFGYPELTKEWTRKKYPLQHLLINFLDKK
jgi:TrpR-related protein YerC/YecD